MALIGITGSESQVNNQLMQYAAEYAPCLIIDCANYANPHAINIPFEKLHNIYVLNTDLLYKLRDTLHQVPLLMRKINAQTLIITPFTDLFHYQDKQENQNIYEHSWELLQFLGKTYTIFVGIAPDQEVFAQRHCDQYGTHRLEPAYST